MPVQVQPNATTQYKSSFAPSANVQLCLRANGVERVAVIDPFGFAVPAGIPAPTVAPTAVSPGGDAGQMNNDQWVAYVYVWGASRRYPFVEGDSQGGNLYPRGNPSPASAPVQINGGSCDVSFQLPDNTTVDPRTGWKRSDLDRVWIYRTIDFDNEADCLLAANAGDFFYLDFVEVPAGTGANQTLTYTDKFTTPTDDLCEYDNFEAPQFQFCIYVDPYWWGFGNFPTRCRASWDGNGLVTMDPTDPYNGFLDGRHKQPCYIKALDPDGDATSQTRQYYAFGNGTYNQCFLRVDTDGTAVPNDFQAGSGYIVFAGPSTTLYRSKYRNPLAWGRTSLVGSIRIPAQYFFKVGGGTGTGIAQVPNMPLLVVSTKGPATTYVLDLRLAGDDTFGGSLRVASTLLSVTSHFSQFAAMQPDGSTVLYGYDQENQCIVACDGNTVKSVSDPYLTLTMRRMSEDPDLVRRVHGLYDPNTQHNLMWLPQANPDKTMNVLVSQSAVTGAWHTQFEGDVSCSAIVEGTWCALRKLYLGTERGMFGIGLDESKTRNWLYDTFQASGLVQSVSNNSLQIETAIPADAPGLVGSWMLVTDVHEGGDLWLRINSVSPDGLQLAFDRVWSPGNANTEGLGDDYLDTAHVHRYYVGLIETSQLRFFDFDAWIEDKKLDELWATLAGCDPSHPPIFQYVRDRGAAVLGRGENYYVITNGGAQSTAVKLTPTKYDDGVSTQQWFTQEPPTEPTKVFGLRIVDRGYGAFRIYGWGGKLA